MGRRSRRKTSASGRLPSRNQQCGKVLTYNRADLAAGGKKKNTFTVPFSRGNNIYRPVPPKKKKIIVHSRRGKNIYRPVPRRENIFTVSFRGGEKYLPYRPAEGKNIYPRVPREETIFTVRPVVKIFPVEFFRPVPSRNYGPAVPSRQLLYLRFTVMSRPVAICFPAKQVKPVPSRPATILGHCDKPWDFVPPFKKQKKICLFFSAFGVQIYWQYITRAFRGSGQTSRVGSGRVS